MAKVRIRKAGPGETPGYYNKTSQFMQKAAAGGTSDPQAFMKQLQGAVYGALQRDQEPEEVYKALLGQKIDPKMANQVISTVYNYMVENGELEGATEEMATEEAAVEEGTEAITPDTGRDQMDQYRQLSMQEAMTEDEDGMNTMDDRSYLEGDDSLFNLFSTSTAPPMQNGGENKKAFVKNVMSMLKKAEGGEGEPSVTAEQTDDLTGTVKKKKQGFIDTLKNTAKEVQVAEWFDNMQSVGDPMMGQLQNILNGAPATTPMAQYGGFTDPSNPQLRMFAEGADTPQLAKNADDPYSNDLVEAQFGRNLGKFLQGMANNLIPINPFFNYAGSRQEQQGSPFNVGDNSPYTGSLDGATPIARNVTKTTMLGRRPKEWVDYYETPGVNKGTLYKGASGKLEYFNPTKTDMPDMMQSDIDARANKKRAGIDAETWDDLGLKSKMALKAKDLLYRGEQMFDQKPKAQMGNNPLANNNFSNSFSAAPVCPPGYYKDPSTGICKNFAGETVMSNAASNATENFQTSAEQMINDNPYQASGTNTLGQEYGYTNQDGTLGGMDLNYEGNFNKEPGLVGVENKGENMYNFSGEELVNASILGRNTAAGFINGVRANKANLKFQNENFNADKIYGSQAALDRGDWTQAGDFRTPEQGADWVNRSMAQYGGVYQEGGIPTFDSYPSDYTENEEVWMTDDEIAEYLANGGEIEYL